nr:4Fe-4S binding protein [Dissulfurirhabdus thermomarina]
MAGNAYWLFPWRAPLYQGPLKKACFPGLNCYSCPAAVGACPLGGLQNALAALRPTLRAGQLQLGGYVAGFLGVVGSLGGRFVCGWICPFGFLQEGLYRLPVPKLGLWRPLRWMPYGFLLVFVVALPLLAVDRLGYGAPYFCKLVCPAGTLEAGLPLLALHPELRAVAGWLFVHKLAVLVALLAWCTMTLRAFCRTICPLGAIYGLFNRVSFLRLRFHPDRCVACGACRTVCPTGVSFFDGVDGPNTPACIRCLRCQATCPTRAVTLEFGPVRAAEETAPEKDHAKA